MMASFQFSSSKPLRRMQDVLLYLADPSVGIIEMLYETPRMAGGPDFFRFVAHACRAEVLSGVVNDAWGGGASSDRTLALCKAVGELVEHYCAGVYDKNQLPLASYREADFECVEPAHFALYSAEQYTEPGFPVRPFEHDTRIRWARAVDALRGEIRYVPASMVYVPYYFDADETPVSIPISTGLACHVSSEEATLNGICEAVERDAFTIAWQAMIPAPAIALESLSAANRELVSRYDHTGYSVKLFNITTDLGIPAVLAALIGNWPEQPASVFSGSASLDPEQAVRKALEEVANSQLLCHGYKRNSPPLVPEPGYTNVNSMHDHARLYCERENIGLLDFLFKSGKQVDFDKIENRATGDPRQDLEIVLGLIERAGYRTLVSDVTTEDVSELGLQVVRVVIPGLHPLIFDHRCRPLGGSRLWTVPQQLGYHGISRDKGDNPAPHPYP